MKSSLASALLAALTGRGSNSLPGGHPFGGSSLEDLFGGGSPFGELLGEGLPSSVVLEPSNPNSITRALGQLMPSGEERSGPTPEAILFGHTTAYRNKHAALSAKRDELQAFASNIHINRRLAKLAKNAARYGQAIQVRIDGVTQSDDAAGEYRARLHQEKARVESLKHLQVNEHYAGIMASGFDQLVARLNAEIGSLVRQYEVAQARIEALLGTGTFTAFALPEPLQPIEESAIWKEARAATDRALPEVLRDRFGINDLPELPAQVSSKKPQLSSGRSRRRSQPVTA